jgi:hypothetical protein
MLDQAIRQSALSRLYTARLLSQSERDAMRKREEELALQQIENAAMSAPSLDGDTQGSTGIAEAIHDPSGVTPNSAEGDPAAQAAVNPALEAALSFMKKYEADKIRQLQTANAGAPSTGDSESKATAPIRTSEPKIGRNDPCHCGSGKKYKQCHGKNA